MAIAKTDNQTIFLGKYAITLVNASITSSVEHPTTPKYFCKNEASYIGEVGNATEKGSSRSACLAKIAKDYSQRNSKQHDVGFLAKCVSFNKIDQSEYFAQTVNKHMADIVLWGKQFYLNIKGIQTLCFHLVCCADWAVKTIDILWWYDIIIWTSNLWW